MEFPIWQWTDEEEKNESEFVNNEPLRNCEAKEYLLFYFAHQCAIMPANEFQVSEWMSAEVSEWNEWAGASKQGK